MGSAGRFGRWERARVELGYLVGYDIMRAGGDSCSQPRALRVELLRIRTLANVASAAMRLGGRLFLVANTALSESSTSRKACSESALRDGRGSTSVPSLVGSRRRRLGLSALPVLPTATCRSSARTASSATALASSGRRLTARYRSAASFITATRTPSTTGWRT